MSIYGWYKLEGVGCGDSYIPRSEVWKHGKHGVLHSARDGVTSLLRGIVLPAARGRLRLCL